MSDTFQYDPFTDYELSQLSHNLPDFRVYRLIAEIRRLKKLVVELEEELDDLYHYPIPEP